ncbi:PEP-CTERM sorting domain-containing protein [Rhodopila sp.]|uniref:PEP-CTERM sorting domain-containing protein n=1 Tax=Rhodopila sp. TaxID=2480087 RepID=UPI003D0DA307
MTSRPMITLFAAAALSVGAFAAAPAHATVFAGSITLTDTTAHTPLNFSGGSTIDFNWNQTTLNTSTHYDNVATYTLDPTKTGVYNDQIEADFDFTQPDVQNVTHGGNATDLVYKVFGFVGSSGAITWNQPNPFLIDFATGDEISLTLDPGIFGQGGYANTGDLSVEVKQTKVPEPMSLSLLGAGLAALGVASRRRPRAMAATA